MKKKIVGIFVCMLMIASTVISVSGDINKNESKCNTIQPVGNQYSNDTGIGAFEVRSKNPQPGDVIPIFVRYCNFGTLDATQVNCKLKANYWGTLPGEAGYHQIIIYFGKRDISKNTITPGIDTFYWTIPPNWNGQLVIAAEISYSQGEVDQNPSNNRKLSSRITLQINHPKTDYIFTTIPLLNPMQDTSTIFLEYNLIEPWPDNWDLSITPINLTDMQPNSTGLVIVNFSNLDGNIIPDIMGEVLINAYVEGQPSTFIGNMTVRAIWDEQEPILNVTHPSNGIYLFGIKLIPWTKPICIGNIKGSMVVEDENLDFVIMDIGWTNISRKNILLDDQTVENTITYSFAFPPGPIFRKQTLWIETWDKAMNVNKKEIELMVFKLI